MYTIAKVKSGETLMLPGDDGMTIIRGDGSVIQIGESPPDNTWVKRNKDGDMELSVCPAGCLGVWDEGGINGRQG